MNGILSAFVLFSPHSFYPTLRNVSLLILKFNDADFTR